MDDSTPRDISELRPTLRGGGEKRHSRKVRLHRVRGLGSGQDVGLRSSRNQAPRLARSSALSRITVLECDARRVRGPKFEIPHRWSGGRRLQDHQETLDLQDHAPRKGLQRPGPQLHALHGSTQSWATRAQCWHHAVPNQDTYKRLAAITPPAPSRPPASSASPLLCRFLLPSLRCVLACDAIDPLPRRRHRRHHRLLATTRLVCV